MLRRVFLCFLDQPTLLLLEALEFELPKLELRTSWEWRIGLSVCVSEGEKVLLAETAARKLHGALAAHLQMDATALVVGVASSLDFLCENDRSTLGQSFPLLRTAVLTVLRLPHYDFPLILRRLIVHEVGHLVGLSHCAALCRMNPVANATALSEIGADEMCQNCAEFIGWK